MATIAPLDPNQKQQYLDQFTSQAKAKGTTMEQEMYNYAQANNISNEGVDQYMGYSPGTAQKWVNSNIKPAASTSPSANPVVSFPAASNPNAPQAIYDSPSPNPPATMPAASSPTGLMGGASAVAAPSAQPATAGSTRLPDSEIQRIIQQSNAKAQSNGTHINAELRKLQQENGLTNEQVDAMMGYPPGTAASWAGGAAGGAGGGSAAAPSTVTPLSEADRAGWAARFDSQAKATGKSVGQVMYEYAQQNGMSNADVDRYMGYPPGTAQAWVDENIGAGGGGGGGAGPGGAPVDNEPIGGGTGTTNQFASLTTTPEQTVAGQMQGLMDPNNPFIQQARTRARVSGNARGLLNSSMTETAADSAAYDAALPIAQADAAQFGRAAEFNASADNQFRMADKAQGFDLAKMDKQAAITLSQMSAEQQNTIAKMALQQGYNLETINANQVNDLAKFAAQVEAQNKQAELKYGYDKGLVEIQKASNLEIAGLESQYRLQTQGSASATSIMNQLPTLIARVMDNKDTTAEAKQAQINYYISTSRAALQLAGQFAGDVDLSGALDDILGAMP